MVITYGLRKGLNPFASTYGYFEYAHMDIIVFYGNKHWKLKPKIINGGIAKEACVTIIFEMIKTLSN